MKTWLMTRVHARRIVIGLTLVLASTLLVSGATIGSEADGQSVDQSMQVAWLRDHFCCEHAAEMAEPVTVVDQSMQVAWLRDHFCCEHAAEMTEA